MQRFIPLVEIARMCGCFSSIFLFFKMFHKTNRSVSKTRARAFRSEIFFSPRGDILSPAQCAVHFLSGQTARVVSSSYSLN